MSGPTREQVIQWAREGAGVSICAGSAVVGFVCNCCGRCL